MPDAFGNRAVLAVLVPVTNVVVEPDIASLRPPGVTNQTMRFPFPRLPDTIEELTELMGPTLDRVDACGPDRVVIAYTPEYMANGVAAASQLRGGQDPASGDKPVVAVNSATYWLALREHGITDRLDGHGVLFADH
jgi:maleate cis-trans isomerase